MSLLRWTAVVALALGANLGCPKSLPPPDADVTTTPGIDYGVSVDAPVSHGNCGNGQVDDGEACDDGNLTNGDGCGADCTQKTCGDQGGNVCTDPAQGVNLCASLPALPSSDCQLCCDCLNSDKTCGLVGGNTCAWNGECDGFTDLQSCDCPVCCLK